MAAELVVAAVQKRVQAGPGTAASPVPCRAGKTRVRNFSRFPPYRKTSCDHGLGHDIRQESQVWQGTGREAGEPPDSVCHHCSLLTYQLFINYYAPSWYMGRNFAVARGWWSRSRCAGEQDGRSSMSENKRDYGVGRGKPPVHGRFKKGQSGNLRRPLSEKLAGIACRGAQRDGGRDHRRRAPGRPRADRTRRRWSSSTIPFRNRIAAVKPHYFGNISRCISARDPSRCPSFVFGTALPRPLKRPCRRDRGTARSVGIAVISPQRCRRRGWPPART